MISTSDLLDRLDASRARTLACYDLDAGQLEARYAPGKWTVRYILHHLADTETVLYERIRRAISEPRPVVWAFDPDAWARELHYGEVPLALSRQIYAAAREGVIYCVGAHLGSKGDREFVHSATGVRTVRDEMEKVAWHNEHHLEQIERALRGTTAGR